MKQILMSKEEYDQLMLDMENLKKEKEQLEEQNAELNKEIVSLKEKIEELEQYIKSGHASNDMYLNQITTIYKSLDIDLVIDKLKREAETYLKKAENTIGGGVVITTPVMRFFDSLKETCIFDYCMKTETEETEYGFCITEQLLYGTLLEAKLSEVSKLNWEIVQLKEEINKLQAEIVKKDNECKYQVSRRNDLRKEYNIKCMELRRATELRDSYAVKLNERIKENRQLNNDLRSLSLKLNYYQNSLCIKLPKWVMRILKHLKLDNKNG